MKIVNLTNICIVAFLCCITLGLRTNRNPSRGKQTTPRTSVKTTKTSIRTSTTSKKPSTTRAVVTTTKRTTTTQRTTTLRPTAMTPLSIRVTSTSATSTSVHSTDVVRTSLPMNTSSSTENCGSEEDASETTTGLKAGTMAGIGVAVTAFTAVIVFILLVIRRRRKRKHHEYKQSSADCTLKPAYGTTLVNVDIDNHQLNPSQDDEAYFELEYQADGGAGTCSTAPCQGKDAALTSVTASDVAVYCNVRHPEHVESHPMSTPSDFPDDYSGLRHQDVGVEDVHSASAVDVIYGNIQNNDSDEYNRLRSEDGRGNTLRSDVEFVDNYDHLQSEDPGEYNILCRPRQDGGTQCTILSLPDTYDHVQNSSITNTVPVCTDRDQTKSQRLDTPPSSRMNYENIMPVTVHKQYD